MGHRESAYLTVGWTASPY